MAGLSEAALDAWGAEQLRGPVEAPQASNSGEFGKGLRRGLQSIGSSGEAAWGALQSQWNQEAGRLHIANAIRDQQQVDAESPAEIGSIKDVGWGNFGTYIAGKSGEVLPGLVPAAIGSVIGAATAPASVPALLAARAAFTAATTFAEKEAAKALIKKELVGLAAQKAVRAEIGGASSFLPQTVGGESMRLQEDPAAALMGDGERLARATVVGGAQAIVGAAPGSSMATRLFTRQPVTKNALARAAAERGSVLAAAGKNTLLGGVGMAGMDLVGQAGQYSYDPGFKYDPMRTADAFAGGLAGMAPLGLVHAGLAKAADHGTAESLLAGAKAAPGVAWSAIKSVAGGVATGADWLGGRLYNVSPKPVQIAADALVGTRKLTKALYDTLAPVASALTGAAKDAWGQAVEEYKATTEGKTGAAAKAAGVGMGLTAAAATAVGHLGHAVDAAPDATTAEIFHAAAKETYGWVEGKVPTEEKLNAVWDAVGKYADTVSGAFSVRLRAMHARFKAGEATAEDTADLAKTMATMSKKETAVAPFDNPTPAETVVGAAPGAPESQSSGSNNYVASLRPLLVAAHIHESVVNEIVKRVNPRTLERKYGGVGIAGLKRMILEDPAITRAIQDAHADPENVYQRVRDVLDKVTPDWKEKRDTAIKAQGDIPASDPEQMRGAIHAASIELLKEHSLFADDPELLARHAEGVTNTVIQAAAGDKGHGAAMARLTEGLHAYGEKGDAFLAKVHAIAQASYAPDVKVHGRLDRLGNGARGLKDTLGAFTSTLRKLPAGGKLLALMREFGADYEAASKSTMTEGQMLKAEARLRSRAATDETASLDEKTGWIEDANRIKAAREAGTTPMDAFEQKYKTVFKAGKLEEAIAAQQKWHKSKQDVLSAENPSGSTEGAARVALADDNDYEQKQNDATARTAEEDKATGDKTEDYTDAQLERSNELGTDSTFKPVFQYHGESSLRGAHKEGDVTAPVTGRKSADHPEGMGARMLTLMRKVWGDKRVAELSDEGIVRVGDWATDQGGNRNEHMNRALDALLAHDAQRKTKLEQMAKHPDANIDEHAVQIQKELDWIGDREKQAADLAGRETRGAQFFHPDGPNRNYGYYKLEPASGANVEVTQGVIKRYTPKEFGGERESTENYVAKRAEVEGHSVETVEGSMIPLHTEDGTIDFDVARAMRDEMSKHQPADMAGVEHGVAGVSHSGKAEVATPHYSLDELARGFATMVGAITTGEGVNGANPLGRTLGKDTPRTKGGAHTKGMRQSFDPSLVIFRDSTGRVVRYHDISGLLGESDGKLFYTRRETTKADVFGAAKHTVNDVVVPAKEGIVTKQERLTDQKGADGQRLVVDERDRTIPGREGPPRMVGGPATESAPSTPFTQSVAAAKNGILRNFFLGKDMNVRKLLAHMMELNGLDAGDLGKLPKALAAQLVFDGLRMLKEKVGGHPLMDGEAIRTMPKNDKVGLFEGSDNRNAWKDAVIYHREYGDESHPVTLGELMRQEDRPDMPRTDITNAKLYDARDQLAKLVAEDEAAANRKADGARENKDYGTVNGLDAARATELRAELARLQSSKNFTPMNEARIKELQDTLRTTDQANRDAKRTQAESDETNALGHWDDTKTSELAHSDSELENFGVKGALKDMADSAGDVPLADRIDAQRVVSAKGRKETLTELNTKIKDRETDRQSELNRQRTVPAEMRAEDKRRVAVANQKANGIAQLHNNQHEQNIVNADQVSVHPNMAATVAAPIREGQTPGAKGASKGVAGQASMAAVKAAASKAAAKQGVADSFARAAKAQTKVELTAKERLMRATSKARRAANQEAILEGKRQADAAAAEAENKSRVMSVRERLEAEEAIEAAQETVAAQQKAAEGMKNGNIGDLSNNVKDLPFSESSKNGEHKIEADDVEGAQEHLLGLAKQLAGDLVDHLNLTRDKITENDASGLWDKAKKMIHVALRTGEESIGVTRHEVWHAIEDYLGTIPGGKEVLERIYKHMDTPLMRTWLKGQFKDDAGALKQITEGHVRERAAYAFQKFLAGEKMPLHGDVHGVWGKIKAFFVRVAQKLGYKNEGKSTENFFNYVKEGEFARDLGNDAATVGGVGDTRLQRAATGLDGFVKPLVGAINVMAGHTSTRLTSHKNAAYNEAAALYEGAIGKAGYIARLVSSRQAILNQLARVFMDNAGEMKEDVVGGKEITGWHDGFETYMVGRGLDAAQRQRVRDVRAYDVRKINDSFADFQHDVLRYGGSEKMDAGAKMEIAQNVADNGFFAHDTLSDLFNGNEAIAKKWLDTDPYSQASRMVFNGVEVAERNHFMGKNDSKLKALLAEGHKTASPEARADMENFTNSYDNKLGAGTMSPNVQKIMGALLVANNVRLLPKAVFSQLMEPVQLAFRRGEMGAAITALGRGIKEMIRTFDHVDSKWEKDDWERLAEDAGTVASAHVGGMMNQIYNGIQIRGVAGKVNDMFFKYNFMEQWNRSMHVAATKLGVEFIRDHVSRVEEGRSALDKDGGFRSERYLKELGLEGVGAGEIFMDGKLNITNDKVRDALVQYVNQSMAHPDAGSNPVWMNDPRFALFAQMKRFNFAHSRYILDRAMSELRNGNMMVLAPATGAVFWMMGADWLKHASDLTSNPSQYDSMGWLDASMTHVERSGAFGRYSLGVDVEKSIRWGGDGISTALGPTADLFHSAVTGFHKHQFWSSLAGLNPSPGDPMVMGD